MPDQPNQQRLDPRTAWQRYRPTRENAWDRKKVGHLFRRAAFGATHADIERALRDGPDGTIDRLLRGGEGTPAFERTSNSLADSVRQGNNGATATSWWMYRILYSPHPLREKLTLFWHDHFATSNLKVNNANYMIGQYQLMYRHAQGNFRTLLQEMSLDPAMMVWLDTIQSQRGRPNENYARELMELFSLGLNDPRNPRRQNYTEEDIREAARAFTGYRIVNNRGVFQENLHDNTEKTVMGRTGRWRADDIVRICLEQPACPYFIVGKLFRFLVSESIEPTARLIEPLASEFRRNYDFGAIVETMLRSNLFFSQQAYRSKIKSPVEFVAGIVRGLEGRLGTTQLVQPLESLGQRLFYPPSVAGWDAGRAWLNGQTLLFRHNLALAITSTQDARFNRRCDPARLARRNNLRNPQQQVDFFLRLFLQGDVPASERQRLLAYAQGAQNQRYPAFWTEQDAADQRIRTLCHLVLTLPEFQLN